MNNTPYLDALQALSATIEPGEETFRFVVNERMLATLVGQAVRASLYLPDLCKGTRGMTQQYKIIEGSALGHCCIKASVIDTHRPVIRRDGTIVEDQFGLVCECESVELAHILAALLNAQQPVQPKFQAGSYDPKTVTLGGMREKRPEFCRCEMKGECGCAFGQCERGLII